MPKQYVIRIELRWINKEGKEVVSYSYFQKFTSLLLPIKHLSDINNAKKYNSRAEALIDWRKYYVNDKRAKVIPVPDQQ